ncbi:MAG: acyl-CoA dehydrogenase family protein, partial [Thermodesulfobacteriota bacterium]|nr:acyl-CoA dehydrogenase family protein [Thermodesulfobacteriota bacterium]
MDYFLTDEQTSIRELTKKIADKEVRPKRVELDETERFPEDIINIMGGAGLMGIIIPNEYGGFGGGTFENNIAIEEISRACIGVAVSFAASSLGTYPFLLYGSEEQKKKYLPEIAAGKKLAAFALTESGAGSDAGGIKTTAVKKGDHYVLNGTKQWITNGGEADIYSVIALTDRKKGPRGASAFIIEKNTPGFTFGKKEKKLGIRTSATRELIFEDCVIPKDNLIGKEGIGFLITMSTLDYSRPGIAAQGVGLAQEALDIAVDYARQRRQFEKPIISFQAVQHMLADMATQIEAARVFVYAVSRYIDSNPKDFSKVSAMTKLFSSDMAMKVATDAVQILGGYGYMRDYPAEKLMRDAKILQIYEGTNQIQRNVIGLNLIKEYSRK